MITEVEIARLKVEPDEVLVVYLPVGTETEDVAYLIDKLNVILGKQAKFLVLPETVRLEVVKHVEN